MKEKIEDNPVPSIDKLTLSNLIEFFENFMDDTSNEIGDSSTEDITVTRIKGGLMLSNEWSKDKIILQNGVETNKEQPKCRKCSKKITFGICYKCENHI